MEKITTKFDKVLNASPFSGNVEHDPDASKEVVSIIFLSLLFANPAFDGLSVFYRIAFAFIIIGVFGIVLGFELKKINKTFKES